MIKEQKTKQKEQNFYLKKKKKIHRFNHHRIWSMAKSNVLLNNTKKSQTADRISQIISIFDDKIVKYQKQFSERS